MTNAIQIFNNPDFGDIRTIMIEDAPWWIGKEISRALGYTNTRDALLSHVDAEDRRVIQKSDFTTLEIPNRGFIIINESGLYSLILSSCLPSAKKFKRWITSEVLPALRKTGRYEMPEVVNTAEQRQLTIDDYIRAASIIAGCRNERMPTVLALLKQSGLSIPKLEEIPEMLSEWDEIGETASLINEAINDYGLSVTRIGKLCGLHATQITRIRTGQCKPRKDRARVICDAIKHEIEKSR